jgi:hypothetical protein
MNNNGRYYSMKKKNILILIFTILMTILIPTSGINIDKLDEQHILRNSFALIPPDIEKIMLSTKQSPEPGFYETSEYMIGSCAVGVIFLESTGTGADPNLENWQPVEELNVQQEIAYSLTQWWETQNADANVDFIIDWNTGIPTQYEPIIHASGITDNTYEQLWVSEAMSYLGYTNGDWMQRTRSYINALRQNKGTDWAFAVFVIDSSNDMINDPYTPGSFTDSYNAYAYIGGPFVVLTYDNGQWGITRMDQVISHETGHIFWATEEYNHAVEYSGYLNSQDNEGSGCLMDTNSLCLSSGTQQQIGWRDTDGDNIHDIIDTYPETSIIPYSPDPTSDNTLIFSGSATVVPHPNNNPCYWNSGNDVTINTISTVQYRLDSGYWVNADPKDGAFDDPTEEFTVTVGPLSLGAHTISVRALNSVGNIDPTPDADAFTIITENSPPEKPSTPSGETSGSIDTEYYYTTSTTDPNGDEISYFFDWGDGTNSGWLTPITSGQTANASHTWNIKDNYEIKVKARDSSLEESPWSDPLSISMPKYKMRMSLNSYNLIFKYSILKYILK